MSQTKSQIGVLALQALHVIEGDATADTNDETIIEAAYDFIYKRLRTLHLVNWGSGDSVPDECVNPVVSLVAESRIGYFKPPQHAETDIRIKASNAITELTEVLANDYVDIPTKAQFF